MTTREMVNVIRGLSGLNLISADVVEVAPAYDHAEVTSLAAATIVYELTNLFAKTKRIKIFFPKMLDKKKFSILMENGFLQKIQKKLKLLDPSTEKSCAVISLGGKDDVNAAVTAAKNAFESWAFTTKEARVELLEKLYVVYKKRWADIAEAITLEMGAPKDFSSQLQTGTGASHIKSFTGYLKEFNFEKVLGDHAKDQKILYEPKGVCALITPWNWPMNQVCLKVIPALAAGCTMILKPSELAPLSSMILAEMIDEVKFPAGVFN